MVARLVDCFEVSGTLGADWRRSEEQAFVRVARIAGFGSSMCLCSEVWARPEPSVEHASHSR